jgi:lysophospholipase L1-like esterase
MQSVPDTDQTGRRGDPPGGRRSARLLARLVLVCLSSVSTLVALEVGARLYAKATATERGMTFDPELGWRPRPFVTKFDSVWGATRPARTNSRGWRDRERTYEKPPGTLRAIALGDSYTFGTDADDGERFTDLLQNRTGLEVVNLGVAGYGTDQELRVLEIEGVRYQPDIVILTVCVFNDLADIGHERLYSWPKPYYTLEQGELRLSKPELTWGMRARTASYLVEFLFQRVLNDPRTPRAAIRTPVNTAQLFDALARRIASVTTRHGARLVAVLAYPPPRLGPRFTAVGRQMMATLEAAGVPTLDTQKLFDDHGLAEDKAYWPSGVHWTAEGHRIVAEGLTRLLADLGVK